MTQGLPPSGDLPPQYARYGYGIWLINHSRFEIGLCSTYKFITAPNGDQSVNVVRGNNHNLFLISNFSRVLNVVCFRLDNSPASEFYMPTFRNTLSHLHRQVGVHLPMKMGQSVPKRWHIKFRRRGITQKKAYNKSSFILRIIQDTQIHWGVGGGVGMQNFQGWIP